MSVVYRSFLPSRSSFDRSWETVSAWWRGIGCTQGIQLLGSGQFGPWSVEHQAIDDSQDSLGEIRIENEESGFRLIFRQLQSTAQPMVFLEEEHREQGGIKNPLPGPSELTRELVASSGLDVSVRNARVPEVLLVGEASRHISLLTLLNDRLVGMALVRNVPLEEAAVIVGTRGSVADGSLVLLRSAVDAPLIIPAQWARFNSAPVARRVHRDVLHFWFQQRLPVEFGAAVARLKRSNRSLEEWQEIAEDFERENKDLVEQRDWALLSQDEALRELDSAQRRLAFLEREFRDRGEMVPSPEEDEEYPDDIRWSIQVLELADEYLHGLVLSHGIRNRCGDLDEQHAAPITARRAWRALRALNDYVSAKRDGRSKGNFLDFCRETPAGYVSFPANDVAMVESAGTLARRELREARMFQVPSNVDPTGIVLMQAHVKVAGVGNLSARLHFFDDTSGSTGKVHVGYLGPHLPLP